jgi:hypothetical protein
VLDLLVYVLPFFSSTWLPPKKREETLDLAVKSFGER